MSKLRRAALAALVSTAALGAVAVATGDVASAAPAVCRDSNGPARGGSVYVVHGQRLGCDFRPPQRLHVTRVPSAAACADMGGHGWSRSAPTCWDVDY